jgi:hypothetical protein
MREQMRGQRNAATFGFESGGVRAACRAVARQDAVALVNRAVV